MFGLKLAPSFNETNLPPSSLTVTNLVTLSTPFGCISNASQGNTVACARASPETSVSTIEVAALRNVRFLGDALRLVIGLVRLPELIAIAILLALLWYLALAAWDPNH